ncbi:MFS transporter [Aerococcus agrisoli]|uniref:MFS transporter n=1 Tax=Aerococcus agrisoli TaxID=2487350 RepID=A0A3N4G5U7_9LACT|nr:MFS transporter [Aerococcus agrisoli]RPA58203.1 MFS transporter [Aerococcus agrisoli]
MFRRSYVRNVPILGAVEFLSFFGINSFWLLFLSQNGMTLWQIGILESILHLTSLLSEVPSGMLADRFSYKSNFYIGRFMSIISAILMVTANGNFWLYALGFILTAWSYNFDSGTSMAFLYESAKEAGKEDKYLKYSSFISGVLEAASALGMMTAGFFVHGLLDYTYYIKNAMSLVVIVLISFMKEPNVKLKGEESPTLKEITRNVRVFIRTNPRLMKWIILNQAMIALMYMFYFYFQHEFTKYTSWQISLIMLVSSIVNIIAVWLANKVGAKWSARKLFTWLVPLVGTILLFAWFDLPSMYVLIYLLADGLVTMYMPIFNNDIQQDFESDIRATLLSVSEMMFSLAMIFIFPVVGVAIDTFGFATSFVGLGFVLLASAVLFHKIIK